MMQRNDNREGQRRLDVWIDEEVYVALKAYEAKERKTHSEAVNTALRQLLGVKK